VKQRTSSYWYRSGSICFRKYYEW